MNTSQNKTWPVFSAVSLGLIMVMILLFFVSGSAQAFRDTSKPENMGKLMTSIDKEKILTSELASSLIYQPNFNKAYYGHSSTLYLLNPSLSTAQVSLTFHGVGGNNSTFTGNYTIASGATLALPADDISGLLSGGSYTLIITSDQPVASVVNGSNEVFPNDNFYSIDGMSTGSTNNVFTPFYDTSGLLLWNVSGSNANFIAYFFDLNGTNITTFIGAIPAGGRYTIYGPSITELLPGAYSVVVTSDQELVGVNMDLAAGYERYETYRPLGTDVSATYLPRALKAYAGQGGTIITILYVTNLGTEPTDATLNFFDSEGTPADSITLNIPGNGYRMVDLGSFSSPLETGVWSVIANAAQPIALSEITRYVTAPIYPSGVYEGGTGMHLDLPRITRSRENYTIISLQNPNASTAEVSIDYYDLSGLQIFAETLSVPAYGWTRIEQIQQSDLGNNFNGSVIIDSDLPVTALVDEYIGAPFSCSDVAQIPLSECEALVALYNSTNGDDWIDNTDWLMTSTPCGWYGVSCDAVNVTEINLGNNHLTGELPPQIGDFPGLVTLNLPLNPITGTLPSQIGDLGELRELGLSEIALDDAGTPSLHGPIPSSFNQLVNLEKLNLCESWGIDGPIPDLSDLTKLHTLRLCHLRLSGPIPETIGNLTSLQHLDISGNQLSEAIPPAIGDLTGLLNLRLEDNRLLGELPSTITNLTALNTDDSCGEMFWCGTDLGYNSLKSGNLDVIAFLNDKDPDWDQTQTIAPSNFQVSNLNASSIEVAWTPINYTWDGGYYEVQFATLPGGPFTVHGVTVDKTASSYLVDGLLPDTTYYIRLRTFTPKHDYHKNDLWSEFTDVISGATLDAGTQAPIPPDEDTILVYTDTEGIETVINIPTSAVTEEVTIAYIPVYTVTESPDFEFAGQSFELNAYQDGVMIDGFTFQKPVTVTLNYKDEDIAGLDEETLLLNYWNAESSSWIDAADTCIPSSEYERNLDENRLAVPICHLSTFGLFGTKITEYIVFLPMSIRP